MSELQVFGWHVSHVEARCCGGLDGRVEVSGACFPHLRSSGGGRMEEGGWQESAECGNSLGLRLSLENSFVKAKYAIH